MREEIIPGQGYGKTLSEEQEKLHRAAGPPESMAKEAEELKATSLGTVRELPRWQTEPLNLIEDIMARWISPIEDEEGYKAVQDRLKYLRAYLPRLKGELLNRAQTAIKLLEERTSDYQRQSLHRFVSQIAEFVEAPIEDDAGLKKAEGYLTRLVEIRAGLVGRWAQVVNRYRSSLEDRITEYRKRSPTPAETSSPRQELGAPEEVPEILRSFFIVTDTSWAEHRSDSMYCRVTTIREGREWTLGFEEGDESYATQDPSFAPDWDFDEPLLRVIKTDNILNITTEKYGGYTHACRINYGGTVLWARVGGDRDRHIGETIGLDFNTLKVVAPGKVSILTKEKILKALPWGIALGSLGYTTYRVVKKK